jgi:hypothetical protein
MTPARWTPRLVQQRLREAFAVELRLPGERPRGLTSVWPAATLYKFHDVLHWPDARERVWQSWSRVKAVLLLFGGRFAEAYCVANDFEQAQSRVFAIIKRIIEASPLLKPEAKVTADKIVFPAFYNATIIALASDAASAAGANPTITCFDELWGYTSERSRRLFDEMITSPARKISCRLTVSYAGFVGESQLLEEIYKRGMQQPEVAPSLHAGDGILFAWHREPISPWQTEAWLSEMRRSLRPNAYRRMIENEFVSGESTFVSMSAWDQCVSQRRECLSRQGEEPKEGAGRGRRGQPCRRQRLHSPDRREGRHPPPRGIQTR